MYHVGISFKGMGSLDTYGMSLGGGSSLLLKTIYQAKVLVIGNMECFSSMTTTSKTFCDESYFFATCV